ncbi:DUF947-domain-containing protein [Annulohypoxylon bovei var. microspora]|nr:DUF947-domain-containing protein [Annulohypoxylon bovei var. microspora]
MERRTTNPKRKAPLSNLNRRVRARRDEPEEISSNESQGEGGSEDESSEEQSGEDVEQDDEEPDSASEDDDDDEADDPSTAASQISFGALAKAQASLPNPRRGKGRKGQDSSSDSENSDQPEQQTKDRSRPRPPQRTSKHAPAEQTSKRQVSRKREVIAVHKPLARDPRFSSAVSGRPLDEEKSRRAYDFLDKYRDDEMAQLRSAIRKARGDEDAQEELRRALKSMQGRKQAQDQREKERAMLGEHRRHEKELVRQGKQPFYLKKSEQKKRLLVDRFAGLKKREVDKVIERRRKKLAARERRDMPMPMPRRETAE